jgi:hypothetical protein
VEERGFGASEAVQGVGEAAGQLVEVFALEVSDEFVGVRGRRWGE